MGTINNGKGMPAGLSKLNVISGRGGDVACNVSLCLTLENSPPRSLALKGDWLKKLSARSSYTKRFLSPAVFHPDSHHLPQGRMDRNVLSPANSISTNLQEQAFSFVIPAEAGIQGTPGVV